jgi:hypothetical protein
MGYLASHVATIPKQGFQWYLIFLEAAYADDIKREIDSNFSILAREVGKNTLVVRGLDATAFRESVFEASAFYDDKWKERAKFPSLLVTNRVPDQVVSDAHILERGKAMILPLADIYREQSPWQDF